MQLKFTILAKTVSEANQREHWARRHKRLSGHKRLAMAMTLESLRGQRITSDSIVVTLTRRGARKLDTDNLAGSQKGIRDGIAKALRIDDGSDVLTWVYKQEPKGSGDYRVDVDVMQ